MLRHHFHIFDSQHLPDDLGVELADLNAAKVQALTFAGAVLSDERPADIWVGSAWTMRVTDSPSPDAGRTFLTLTIAATDETADARNAGAPNPDAAAIAHPPAGEASAPSSGKR